MMKKFLVTILAACMLLTFVGCAGNSSDIEIDKSLPEGLQEIQKRGKLRVGTKVDVPQFGYQNPDTGEVEGLEIDVAKALAKKLLGDENLMEIHAVTSQTRETLIENGEVDMVIATFTITEERQLSFNFSQPYYTDGIGFLVKKDLGATKITDLADKTIGVVRPSTTREALEEKAEELGISFSYSEFPGFPELKMALTAGRIDAFCVDKSILLGYVDEETEILDETFKPQDYGIVSKLSDKDLATYIDAFIAELKSDGTLQKLIEKWDL